MHFTESTEASDSETYTLLKILLPVACGTILLFVLIICIIICAIKRMCVAKMTLEEDHTQQPVYEEITRCNKDNIIPMEENAAYGHIMCTTKTHQFHFI